MLLHSPIQSCSTCDSTTSNLHENSTLKNISSIHNETFHKEHDYERGEIAAIDKNNHGTLPDPAPKVMNLETTQTAEFNSTKKFNNQCSISTRYRIYSNDKSPHAPLRGNSPRFNRRIQFCTNCNQEKIHKKIILPQCRHIVSMPNLRNVKYPLHRCMILSETNEKYLQLIEQAGPMPSCMNIGILCKKLGLPLVTDVEVKKFVVLDDTDEITPTLGYIIISGSWKIQGGLSDGSIVNLIGSFEYNDSEYNSIEGSCKNCEACRVKKTNNVAARSQQFVASMTRNHIVTNVNNTLFRSMQSPSTSPPSNFCTPDKGGHFVFPKKASDANIHSSNNFEQNYEVIFPTPYFLVTPASRNIMILHPDLLISCTKVASGLECSRRPYFETMYMRGNGKTNLAALNGTMLHEVIQKLLLKKDFNRNSFLKEIDNFIEENSMICMTNNINKDELRNMAISMYNFVKSWCKENLSQDMINNNLLNEELYSTDTSESVTDSNPLLPIYHRSQRPHFPKSAELIEIIDIEETLWSPTYGLKGKVDITWRALQNGQHKLYPLEMKSSSYYRDSISSRRNSMQLMLYILMLSDLYSDPMINIGSLLYINGGTHLEQTVNFDKNPIEIGTVLRLRNSIANAIQRKSFSSPGPLPTGPICSYCPVRAECMLFHKAIEGGCGIAPMNYDLYLRETELLKSNKEIEFVRKWLFVIDLEDKRDFQENEIWTTQSFSKELKGTCMSSMAVIKEKKMKQGYIYTFEQHSTAHLFLNQLAFCPGDRVVISSDDSKWVHLGIGTLQKITKNTIDFFTTSKLRTREVSSFRIDLYIRDGYTSTSRSNILQLFVGDGTSTQNSLEPLNRNLKNISYVSANSISPHQLENKAHLRSMVVKQHQPQFCELTCEMTDLINQSEVQLNSDQKIAIQKILTCKNYVLIHGMPGTGKSSTIAAAIDLLVGKLRKRVLISTFTHSALDNILLKIMNTCKNSFRVFRMNSSKYPIDKSIEKLVYGEEYFIQNNIAEQNGYIVGCTTASAGSSLILEGIDFDYCIIDEAGQITTPSILGALRHGRKFILIGDPEQLPPLVENKEAITFGLGDSLLSELSKVHPEASCELSIQYRMNSSIMELSNRLIYNGRMSCGSPLIEKSVLYLPLAEEVKSSNWISRCIAPENPVVFLNTDPFGSRIEVQEKKSTSSNKFCNEKEAYVIYTVVLEVIKQGLNPCDIGIIAPYNYQVKQIREKLKNLGIEDLLIETIDRFQGIEKRFIIISLVRHNPEGEISNIMTDKRRVNVAITRAQQKLLLLGSASTHMVHPLWKDLLQQIQSNETWIELPSRISFSPLKRRRTTENEDITPIATRLRLSTSQRKQFYETFFDINHLRRSKRSEILRIARKCNQTS